MVHDLDPNGLIYVGVEWPWVLEGCRRNRNLYVSATFQDARIPWLPFEAAMVRVRDKPRWGPFSIAYAKGSRYRHLLSPTYGKTYNLSLVLTPDEFYAKLCFQYTRIKGITYHDTDWRSNEDAAGARITPEGWTKTLSGHLPDQCFIGPADGPSLLSAVARSGWVVAH